MTTPEPATLLGQFDIRAAVTLRALAGLLRRTGGPTSGAGVVPTYRQATVTALDGGTPPTVTISFDGIKEIPGIRYMAHYTPVVGNVVEVLIRAGDPTVWGRRAT